LFFGVCYAYVSSVLDVASIYFEKPQTLISVTKILQSVELKCDGLVVESQPAVFQPPCRRLDIQATVATAVNKFIYSSEFQLTFGLQ